MSYIKDLKTFLEESGYSEENWISSGLDWENVKAIAEHHTKSLKILNTHSGSIANRLQGFEGVHSVRWRVKDTFSLMKKILRKNLEPNPKEKWQTINANNYTSVVSDLIGIRALHLLKEDCVTIDEQIREIWNITSTTIFKRHGDRELNSIIERGALETVHEAGYRSIHYDLHYAAEKKPVLVEIQVRTIFQEGWSEIDHKVKYPDFSNNTLLIIYLDLFNALSGTVDDMGSFVIKLDDLIKSTDAETVNNEAALAARDLAIENLQKEIHNLKSAGEAPKATIDSLQSSVDNIRRSNKITNQTTQQKLSRMLDTSYSISLPTLDMSYFENLRNIMEKNNSAAQAMAEIMKPNEDFIKALQGITAFGPSTSQLFEQIGPSSPELKTIKKNPAYRKKNINKDQETAASNQRKALGNVTPKNDTSPDSDK
ncbi:RelA/SpoT domain-containing protein [Pseudomonas alliivorans]|nr:RelA/SpoT domain-containing protein [Pseudomonas alliivorans]